MARKVRRYTPDFKQEAVHLALKSDSVVNTAKSLGIPTATRGSIASRRKAGILKVWPE